ncbi:ketoacyl-ACP synthase III [Bacillus sp. 31A1R]|uniref:Ketoacyl-ACP synthase III n=1 Tax=Robertmurraya mangrovi TaxID=3098077 RepID=A0ABU5J1M6_9BACI|nr:ketoacyl-ACP synthase III [Bacillus sp. 31A1R]MDZ5473309.1 ketoacyl-ACP synthase III [Bacillus sp. 31A1R]
MKARFTNVSIKGISSAIPKGQLELGSLEAIYGEGEVKKIIASTGIESVRVSSDNQCTSDLCKTAAKALFARLEIDPLSVDGIIFISQTPDYKMPATSVLLQHQLGLPTTAVAFDINYGCSGYVYGLYQAFMLIQSGGCNRVLVCVGDTSTKFVHPGDRSVRMVFGDGGSATLIERGEETSYFILRTDGSGAEHLIIPAGGARKPISEKTSIPFETENGNIRSEENIYMNGMEIMSFALREIPPMINELLDEVRWSKEDVGIYALHQANKFMLDYLRKKMKLNKDAVPVAVSSVGNTGPASIPLMLSQLNQVLPKERLEKVICCGFGVGLSWASCTVNLSSTTILDPIECE